MEARIWLIAGPTASGKSALALRLAQETGGEIVNADALQLYRDLRILSARPSVEEAAVAPHHLFGIADAGDGWSVGRWLEAASKTLAEIAGRKRPAIVVGGTGLYFRALTEGLADIPPVPHAARDAAEQAYDVEGEAAVRSALNALDPLAETRISPGDRQRLTRALAVGRATGRPLSAWQAETKPAIADDAWCAVVLAPSRDALYGRIDARLTAMAQAGAVEEAAALIRRDLDPRLPAMKAVGLRELAACAAGEATLEEAIAAAQQATRRYAKRQLTWFRNQTPDWPRIEAVEPDAQWAELEDQRPRRAAARPRS
jgi:tRNA dimethylallyltransferase